MAIQDGHRSQLEDRDINLMLSGEVPHAIIEHVLNEQGKEVSFFLPQCTSNKLQVRDTLMRVLYDNIPYARVIPKNGHIVAIAEMDGLLQCPEMIPRALENLHSNTEDDSFFDLSDDEWRDHMQHARHFLGEQRRDYGQLSEQDKKFWCTAECAEVLVQQLLQKLKGITDTFQIASRGGTLPPLPTQKFSSGNVYNWYPSTTRNMKVHKQLGQPVAEFDAVAWSPSLQHSDVTEKLYLFDASISSDAIKKKIRQSPHKESQIFMNDLSSIGIDVHRIHIFVHDIENRRCPEILRCHTTKNEHIAMLPSTPAFDSFIERTFLELGEIHPAPLRKYVR